MSRSCDHGDEMGFDQGVDDRLAEDLLRGRTAALGAEHRPVVEAVEALRRHAAAPPRPSEPLRRIFAEGVGADAEVSPVHAAGRRGSARPVPAGPVGVRGLVARAAGLSLAVKMVIVGSAVAATAIGGAGAAGVLPGQAGDAAGEADAGLDVADDATVGDVPPGLPGVGERPAGVGGVDDAPGTDEARADRTEEPRAGEADAAEQPHPGEVDPPRGDEHGPRGGDAPTGPDEAHDRADRGPDPSPADGHEPPDTDQEPSDRSTGDHAERDSGSDARRQGDHRDGHDPTADDTGPPTSSDDGGHRP